MKKKDNLNDKGLWILLIFGLLGLAMILGGVLDKDNSEFKITKEECSKGKNIPLFIEKFNSKFIIAYDGNPEGTSARMFVKNETQIITDFSLAGLEEVDKNFIGKYLKENNDKINDIYWEDVCLVERGSFILGRDIASCNYEELLKMSYHYGQYYPQEFIDLNLKKNDNKLYNLKNIKIEGEGIREYENKIKNLRYDQNNIKVILTFEQYDYPFYKQESVCEQVEVDKLILNCLEDERGISCNEGGGIFQKNDLTIDWLHENCEVKQFDRELSEDELKDVRGIYQCQEYEVRILK